MTQAEKIDSFAKLARSTTIPVASGELEFSKYGRSILPIGLPLSDTTKGYFNKWSASLAKYHTGA